MYFKPLLVTFLLFTFFRSIASEVPVVKINNPYIKYILAHPSNSYQLLDFNSNLLLKPNRLNEVSYLVTKERILYRPNGTGYLFEIKQQVTDSQVSITRIDSTYYTGYNFIDYLIQKNDTIFSIGGQGFWHNNGQLRYFAEEKGEWEMLPIQKWFPISAHDVVDIRINKGKIYTFFLENKQANSFTKEQGNVTDSVIVFNFKGGTVTNIGSVLPNIKLINSNLGIKIETAYGLLIITNVYVKLLDFENNRYTEWTNSQLNNLFNSTKAEIKPVIIRDSVLLFYNFEKLDSIVLPISQFKFISNIYNPIIPKADSLFSVISGTLILLSVIFLIFIYYKKRTKGSANELNKNNSSSIEIDLESHINVENINNLNSLLEPNEIYLLDQILSNNNRISVEQLNYILGLDKKNMQVQKKNRSSIISSINIKFKSEYAVNDELIQRIKDDDDARNIIYQISLKYYDLISSWHKP